MRFTGRSVARSKTETVPPYWSVAACRPPLFQQLGLVEIDDGHVVASMLAVLARALRIDGDAKRMRVDLDRAFAGKSFHVNVVAIGGHDQRAIGR